MLSVSEASQFLQSCGVRNAGLPSMGAERLEFLNSITVALQQRLPFQTLTQIRLPPNQRHAEDAATVKANMLQGFGGLCLELSYFTSELLQALGFSASLIGGYVREQFVDHAIVLVEHVALSGDKYLVDVGFGYPTYRAVALDFQRDSPVFADSFLTYKYAKDEQHHNYYRLHSDSGTGPTRFTTKYEDGWSVAYRFTLNKYTYEQIASFVEQMYRNPDSPLLAELRVVGCVNGKFLAIRNRQVYREEDQPPRLAKSNLENDEQVRSFLRENFPAIPDELVASALDRCKAQ